MNGISLRKAGRLGLLLVVAAVLAALVPAVASAGVIASGLDNPRGIAVGAGGHVFVAESLSGEITKLHPHGRGWPASTFATVPGVVDVARPGRGLTYAVVGGPPEEPGDAASLLVRIRPNGSWSTVADIAAYQAGDPDPYDQEDNPTESNPNGLAVLGDGRILVADAAGNDLLLVRKNGSIRTVARFPTREVAWPTPGSSFDSEAVPTAVAVGPDGAWYVSELRGFPFTPGASQIWRIDPSARSVDCSTSPLCSVHLDGFTSVIDLTFPKKGLLVLEIAKEGLFAVEELGAPPIGALWAVRHGRKTELAPGRLLAPGGVAVGCKRASGIFVTTGTVFGPGAGEVVRLGGGHGRRGC